MTQGSRAVHGTRPLAAEAVRAKFPDHEVITPKNGLIRAVGIAKPGDADPVALAEQAIEQLSSEFTQWMDEECAQLDKARNEAKRRSFDPPSMDDLFRAAHDIKGHAATFGFPRAADAAESLCRLIEHGPDASRLPVALLDQHVDAVRAIVREHDWPDADDLSCELVSRLRDVTTTFLVEVNRDRPEMLEILLGTPGRSGP